ncbi:MAG: flagellar motor protein [Gammaproteobacteria bacterium]|nr:flagellar motor protein [Gammaproteobacteria bacterium]MDH5802634.1 flagellar motor protein [Gammaproteobacteria bacterium]
MDGLSILGLLLGVGAILLGQQLEGGHIQSLMNGPALVIVFGGTLGAAMLQSPFRIFLRSLRMGLWVFFPPSSGGEQIIQKIIAWSNIARKEGLLGLETLAETESDPFARKGLQLLVDGSEPEVIRRIMEVEMDAREQNDLEAAKVYDAMGGYCPTIGIIGAVMGLIHVMENLADPSKLGGGIATAFVATIYGVGLANIVFLPFASKLKSLVRKQMLVSEMMVEGVISIAEGENPRSIETKLQGFVG